MEGTYTCAKRVVKDGVLVCFEGQEMTMDEARSLALVAFTKKVAANRQAINKRAAKQTTVGEEE